MNSISEKKNMSKLIAKTKAQYYNNKIKNTKSNTDKIWKNIREIFPSCKNNARNCNFEDEITKANEFNFHFADVGKNAFEKKLRKWSMVEVYFILIYLILKTQV